MFEKSAITLIKATPQDEMSPLSPPEILRLMDTSLGATVSVLDRSLRFRYVNAGFAEAFNLTWQEMMGMSVYDVYGSAEVATFLPYVERALAGDDVTYERLGRIHHHESVWRTVSIMDTEVRDETPSLVCQRIFSLLREPCLFQQGQAKIGASIGIARHPPLSNQPEALLNRADAAMFEAKRAGKGCVREAWLDQADGALSFVGVPRAA